MDPVDKKTRIVCTIGPASQSQETLEQMIAAGMNVARLNFAHGDFDSHARVIETIRTAAKNVGCRVALLADLPGPKIRIGRLAEEPIELERGKPFTLSVGEAVGGMDGASTSFANLPEVIGKGDTIFLNDGMVQLNVESVSGQDVHCTVIVGGPLRSNKGMNLPNVDLGISAFTERDRECLAFAVAQSVDAVSQSFVERGEDIEAVRSAAAELGGSPFIVAKIERARAFDNIDAILAATDGIMVARGDLGVEIPIEDIAVAQKELIRKANALDKPVITATQMLVSMVDNRRPTRAEATDVANAILDGTDCVMLSEESAMGNYPLDAVRMLASIAQATEPQVEFRHAALRETDPSDNADIIARTVAAIADQVEPIGVLVPTKTGATVRRVARFRLPVGVTAVSRFEATCQRLQLTYGVEAVHVTDHPGSWQDFARNQFKERGPGRVVVTEGTSASEHGGTNRLELIDL